MYLYDLGYLNICLGKILVLKYPENASNNMGNTFPGGACPRTPPPPPPTKRAYSQKWPRHAPGFAK